eukprot:TRINITY_DN13968_c0_g1_i1.p1 TRINITY_DN13968_c0_g1~~TRINITY_DN13968_c0_g1_i1.p1  ORF type:complete len:797 (+),score=251.12 TRINITY_DN13968_c0_g1_i1:85-2475(+)
MEAALLLLAAAQCPPGLGDVAMPTLAGQVGLGEAAALLRVAAVGSNLSAEGRYTLFAPTDAAFAALPAGVLAMLHANASAADAVLSALTVNQSLAVCQLSPPQVLQTLAGGSVTVTAAAGRLAVALGSAQANVTATNLAASNGYIHTLESVLMPGSVAVPSDAALATAAAAGYTAFAASVAAAGLSATVDGERWGGRCFMPPNSAFASPSMAGVAADPAAMAAVMRHHCTAARGSLSSLASVTALSGDVLPVSAAGGNGTVAGAAVVGSELYSSTAVLQGVAEVLLPPGFAPPADTRRSLTVRVDLYPGPFCSGSMNASANATVYAEARFGDCRQAGNGQSYRLRAAGCPSTNVSEWELAVFADGNCTAQGVSAVVVPETCGLIGSASASVTFRGATAAELCTLSAWHSGAEAEARVVRTLHAGTSCGGAAVQNATESVSMAGPSPCGACGGACCPSCRQGSYSKWDAAGFGSSADGRLRYCAREGSYMDQSCVALSNDAASRVVVFGECVPISVDVGVLNASAAPASAAECSAACASQPAMSNCVYSGGRCNAAASVRYSVAGVELADMRRSLCVVSRFSGAGRFDAQGLCDGVANTTSACSQAEADAAAALALSALSSTPTASPTAEPTAPPPPPIEDTGSGSGESSRVPPWAMVTFGMSIGICAICLVQCSQRNRSRLAAVGDTKTVVHHAAHPNASRKLLDECDDSSTGSSASGEYVPPAAPPLIPPLPASEWAAGSTARLSGLHRRPELNGAEGRVLSHQDGMVIVDFAGRGVKAVRPRNLEQVDKGLPAP